MHTDIVIVGSGPSGLALGSNLAQLNQDFVILEKGEAAQTWATISPDLSLLTPWWLSAPLRRDIFAKPIFNRIQANEYHRHLGLHADALAPHLRTGHHVQGIRRDHTKFVIEGDFGTLGCNRIVASSGYYSAPHMPSLPSDGSIPTMHAGDYAGMRSLLASTPRRILIVGRRITAGQVLEQLHDAGHTLAISARDAKVTYQRLRKPSTVLETGYYLGEYVFLGMLSRMKVDTYPGMGGGKPRTLIEAGEVPVFTLPKTIKDGVVQFEDGMEREFDLIVFATGYRPALDYIDGLVNRNADNGLPVTRNFECIGQPGLYLLGFDNLINMRSRSFRGIRKDARALAGILAGKR